MAVEGIEKYRQQNGENILKVILKSTQNFPDGYFYCDASDEKLVRSYTWHLENQKHPYVVAGFGDFYSHSTLCFHREKAFNILRSYPNYINHIDGIEYDNVNSNLDVVSQSQNLWCKVSKE